MKKEVKMEEALSIKLGRFLQEKGFIAATPSGSILSALSEMDSLGILSQTRAQPETYFFGLFKEKARRLFLGVVWFNNKARNASADNWTFDFYGRVHKEMLQNLAAEMSSKFDVNITLRLVGENPHTESLPCDFYADYA